MKRERRSPLLSPLLGHAIPDLSTAPSSLSGCQCLQGDDTDDQERGLTMVCTQAVRNALRDLLLSHPLPRSPFALSLCSALRPS
ncbi:hypothetical protein ACTXT7_007660 [Hymenolepis weldensis]